MDEVQRGLLVDRPRVRSQVQMLPPGLWRPIPRRPPERGVDLRTSSPRNPGEDDVGCGEVQYWWETSRLEVKFEKGTDIEQRARLSDAPLALRSDDDTILNYASPRRQSPRTWAAARSGPGGSE